MSFQGILRLVWSPVNDLSKTTRAIYAVTSHFFPEIESESRINKTADVESWIKVNAVILDSVLERQLRKSR